MAFRADFLALDDAGVGCVAGMTHSSSLSLPADDASGLAGSALFLSSVSFRTAPTPGTKKLKIRQALALDRGR